MSVAANSISLEVSKGAETKDDFAAEHEAKDWLNPLNDNLFLMFNNVDDVALVFQVWPSNNKGSSLIIRRYSSVAWKEAMEVVNLLFPVTLGDEPSYDNDGIDWDGSLT